MKLSFHPFQLLCHPFSSCLSFSLSPPSSSLPLLLNYHTFYLSLFSVSQFYLFCLPVSTLLPFTFSLSFYPNFPFFLTPSFQSLFSFYSFLQFLLFHSVIIMFLSWIDSALSLIFLTTLVFNRFSFIRICNCTIIIFCLFLFYFQCNQATSHSLLLSSSFSPRIFALYKLWLFALSVLTSFENFLYKALFIRSCFTTIHE